MYDFSYFHISICLCLFLHTVLINQMYSISISYLYDFKLAAKELKWLAITETVNKSKYHCAASYPSYLCCRRGMG